MFIQIFQGKDKIFGKKIVKKKELICFGGSDFHGSIRKVILGDCGISKKDFKKLKI
jgi:hypothetical protein